MDNAAWNDLKIRASICPSAETWPEGNYEVSLLQEKPVIKGELHWCALRSAVDVARKRVAKAFGEFAVIDDDKSLSREGKASKKKEVAEAAVAHLERSKSLEKARASVDQQLARWNEQLGLTQKVPESVGEAVICAEIRSHLASLKTGDRVAFIDAHTSDVAQAVLTAPSFLSGLTPAELGVVKQRIEARANPEIAEAKAETAKALQETEAGWRAAIRQISDRGGLGRSHDGRVRAATAADVALGARKSVHP